MKLRKDAWLPIHEEFLADNYGYMTSIEMAAGLLKIEPVVPRNDQSVRAKLIRMGLTGGSKDPKRAPVIRRIIRKGNVLIHRCVGG